MNRVIVAIYIDPDFYPPTINAILNLAENFKEVIVICRNNSQVNYPFPANVYLKKAGRFITVKKTEAKGILFKIFSFLQFTVGILKYARSSKTDLLILYDAIPLFAFFVSKNFIRRKLKVWYHNHDMPDITIIRKFSIGWFSAKYEHAAMKYIHFFSLPSSDRLQFYPVLPEKLKYFTIPNYPSLKVYHVNPLKKTGNQKLSIIFQGFVGEGLALESMIELLNEKIMGMDLQLMVKGPVNEEYKSKLSSLALRTGVSEKLKLADRCPYVDLPAVTRTCDVGMALYIRSDNVSRTVGTASNKIYEYAASGLPVIVYNTDQFKKYLGKYSWAFFSDGSRESLINTLTDISANLGKFSQAARADFENELNFERQFNKALKVVSAELKNKSA